METRAFKIRNSSRALEGAIRSVYPRGIKTDVEGEPLADVTERSHIRLRLAVARAVFGREFSRGRDLEAYMGSYGDDHYDERHNAINEAMLPLYGVGPDSFWLNENLERNEMRRISDLLAYDRGVWEYNEGCRAEIGIGIPGGYHGRMHWEWARWLEKGGLVYGTLSLAAELVCSTVDEAMSDWLDARWPTEFRKVEGEDGLTTFQSVPEDNAREKHRLTAEGLAEIGHRLEGRWRPWHEAQPEGVAMAYDQNGSERTCEVVFMNTNTLARVRPRSFLTDIAALPDASETISAYAEKEVKDFMDWLSALHDNMAEVSA